MAGVPRLMSFPLRLDATGAIATVSQGSDTEVDEQIALAMLTRPGERIQAPTFGVADPTFAGFQLGALQRHLNDFGPEVDVVTVTKRALVDGREEVVINWKRRDHTREVTAP
jgi:hypothetical protein